MFFLSAGDLHEHGGSAGPGGSREGTQPRALGGRWDPQGQGPVGIRGTTSCPWAVLPSRTASIPLHIPWQSEIPSAAGAPVPALLPPLVPHRAGHQSHLGCIRCSTVSTTPSSHPHPSAWHRPPLPRPEASWCSWDSEIQITGVLLRPAPDEVRHAPRGMSAPGALPERSVSPFKSLKHCYYSEAKQR